MIGSAYLTTLCVQKLIQCGLHLDTYSYSKVVELVLGRVGRIIIDIIIAVTQYSFTISHIAFICQSLRTTLNQAFLLDTGMWIYAVPLISILTPFAWVRDIAKFSFTFMAGNFMILLTVIVVSVQCGIVLEN